MNEFMYLVAALLAGMLLGLFYFGGLWVTVQRIPTSRVPLLLTIGSFLLRAGIVLGGFYIVAQGEWLRVIVSLVGFILMRIILLFKLLPMMR
ncbi:MAG: ATP synthase subunit I [Anaerolineales bacterium]|nr:ATP synthase subunit I [Anaerolineales bacterium]